MNALMPAVFIGVLAIRGYLAGRDFPKPRGEWLLRGLVIGGTGCAFAWLYRGGEIRFSVIAMLAGLAYGIAAEYAGCQRSAEN